ncbi:MAG: 3',5'-cyclic-nucleotide phosphodiesterase [Planctomycetia bacterium]|nr:3',5'-cyclic-nucleotide phosphodiesterase [Planctomycetia bacterium]
MKITLLPSSLGIDGAPTRQFLTSFLINDTVAIDAGSLGYWHRWQDQARVQHIFLSHSHMDHVASLPLLLENVYERGPGSVTVHGSDFVLDCLSRDMFNDRIWPNFIALSRPEDPFIQLSRLEAGKTVEVEGLRLTPVAVDHTIPTLGFVVEDATTAVVIVGDTGPTEEIWRVANALPNLRAVFLETSFPDALSGLATISRHLTPATFAQELRKLQRPVPVYVVHIKARYHEAVVREITALQLPDVHIAEGGRPYTFQ